MSSKERYEEIAAELAQVCRDAGRDPSEVTIVAVSKTVGPAEVADALAGGACDFGENRPDQLMEKADRFTGARWHFIGNIQSRRIRDIVGRAELVHSVFQERHARKIDEVAREKNLVQDILIEVNVSGEASKSGLNPADVRFLLEVCEGLPNVCVRGLMTMAPRGEASVARATFAGLAQLQRELQHDFPGLVELSMGMTEDWREAVREGATLVRIGRAIFSDAL